eukprot:scaffold21749_cov49-Prasinocladus_malaysianus.AAC.1
MKYNMIDRHSGVCYQQHKLYHSSSRASRALDDTCQLCSGGAAEARAVAEGLQHGKVRPQQPFGLSRPRPGGGAVPQRLPHDLGGVRCHGWSAGTAQIIAPATPCPGLHNSEIVNSQGRIKLPNQAAELFVVCRATCLRSVAEVNRFIIVLLALTPSDIALRVLLSPASLFGSNNAGFSQLPPIGFSMVNQCQAPADRSPNCHFRVYSGLQLQWRLKVAIGHKADTPQSKRR